MADPQDRRAARKGTNIMLAIAAAAILVLFISLIWGSCHEGDVEEEQINPDGELPGTQDATGWRAAPDAVPLLRAA